MSDVSAMLDAFFPRLSLILLNLVGFIMGLMTHHHCNFVWPSGSLLCMPQRIPRVLPLQSALLQVRQLSCQWSHGTSLIWGSKRNAVEREQYADENSSKELNWMPQHICDIHECKPCSASHSYIVNFFCFTLQNSAKCLSCLSSLFLSVSNPYANRSLILMKNFFQDHQGSKYSSASLCSLFASTMKILSEECADIHEECVWDANVPIPAFPGQSTLCSYSTGTQQGDRWWHWEFSN